MKSQDTEVRSEFLLGGKTDAPFVLNAFPIAQHCDLKDLRAEGEVARRHGFRALRHTQHPSTHTREGGGAGARPVYELGTRTLSPVWEGFRTALP